jgi:predicted nicotinamide N-methyase
MPSGNPPCTDDLHALAATVRANTAVVTPALVPEIKLRLVTKEQPWWYARPEDLERHGIVEPYWAFCWPGGAALARFLLDHPELCRGRRVLDLGSGCGVSAIAAARAGARSVVACDIDPVALWATAENASFNGCDLALEGRNVIGLPLPEVDCLLLGDVTYSRELVAAVWPWLGRLLESGITIWIAEPRRGFLPPDLRPMATVRVPPDCDDVPLESGVEVPIYELTAAASERFISSGT